MVSKVKVKVKVKSARRGRTSTSKISIKNQVTVPVDILRQVGIQAGDQVEFSVNGAGFIEVRPSEESGFSSLAGKYGYIFEGFDLVKERQSWNR